MNDIIELLLDHGSLGIFAAFLVWLYTNMQKRMDKLVDRFQEQLSQINHKAEENETKLRDRYDAVISSLQDDKSIVRDNIAGKLSDTIREIQQVQKEIESLPFSGIQVQIEALSMGIDQNHSILQKIMEIKRKQEEEEKIKAMALKLKD